MPRSEITIEEQQQLIASLRTRLPFPEPCTSVEIIETHISWVLLCGRFAYKIKKALNLGFLDFSTLAKRKQYCLEELRLNRRLAPQLYLEMVAIGGSRERPLFGSAANPIEYAVKMARFAQSELLDRRLREGRLDRAHIDRLADLVADFHARQSNTPPSAELGTPESVHAPVRANFTALRETVTVSSQLQRIADVEAWSEAQYAGLHDTFAERKRSGFIRECHGDMHLGNMAVHDGELLIFDGIEFNPSLYWIDVMSEVAFVFMDLGDHGRADYAWRFLNGYLARTGDYAGVRVLRYYLCYRAMVRAKVAAIRAAQTSDHEATAALDDYLSLALRYSKPRTPVLAVTHGLSGSGKSTLCTPLAERIGAVHLRSDRERQRLFGRGGGQGIATGVYGTQASDQTYERLRACADHALAAQFSVIVDATFLDPLRRACFAALAAAHGVPFWILHFDAGAEQLRERIRQRQSLAQDISEADLTVLEQQLARYTPLTQAEQPVSVSIDTESTDLPKLVDQIAHRLSGQEHSDRESR